MDRLFLVWLLIICCAKINQIYLPLPAAIDVVFMSVHAKAALSYLCVMLILMYVFNDYLLIFNMHMYYTSRKQFSFVNLYKYSIFENVGKHFKHFLIKNTFVIHVYKTKLFPRTISIGYSIILS